MGRMRARDASQGGFEVERAGTGRAHSVGSGGGTLQIHSSGHYCLLSLVHLLPQTFAPFLPYISSETPFRHLLGPRAMASPWETQRTLSLGPQPQRSSRRPMEGQMVTEWREGRCLPQALMGACGPWEIPGSLPRGEGPWVEPSS